VFVAWAALKRRCQDGELVDGEFQRRPAFSKPNAQRVGANEFAFPKAPRAGDDDNAITDLH
jgi:hypothetical protein